MSDEKVKSCPYCGVIPIIIDGYASITHERGCFIMHLLGWAKGVTTDGWAVNSNYHYRWNKRINNDEKRID